MREEKHLQALREVDQTVETALAAQDLLVHQRRLAAMLSLGAQQIVELHLHRQMAIKPGASVKHEWFGLGKQNLLQKLESVITVPAERVPKLIELIVLAQAVEKDRNEHVYGSPLADSAALRLKIAAYLDMKKEGV